MTYLDEPEVRRPSRGAKVLGFGLAILAVLGSFWGIVWFIRSYVEPPRVMRPSPLALAARDSTPVTVSPQTRRIEATTNKAPSTAAAADPADRAATTSGIADRWAPFGQAAPAATQAPLATREAPPAAREFAPVTNPPMAPTIAATPATLTTADPAPLPTVSATTSVATTTFAVPDPEALEEVVLSFTPAIRGPAPLPRRRPVITASAAKRNNNNNAEPPLPRPRPDGPAPQSAFTAVPVTDDRFPTQ